ncbi:histidine kinase [Scytonema hofmannii PCC 7110]|uniref:Histidine kinase n=1 Tax=Scytonema hofmannii PCC 7110 TaxID=128403 RepID=A0A139WQC9_9CYAN|nr:histidine kinase [Scytonema hofmannii PCC 7110]
MKYVSRKIWRQVQAEIGIWRVGALPGLSVIALVIIARLLGFLQPLELSVFDYFLKLRPAEPTDERILIVGINKEDIRSIKSYPIPDGELALLLAKLQTYKPSAIGLDLFRGLPVEPGHTELVRQLKQNKNIIGIEKVLPYLKDFTTNPPPEIPPDQVGFVDTILDRDGYLRRNLLGTSDLKGRYKFSLPIRLAETYLSSRGFSLENGIQDSQAMRFGGTELPRFLPNFGGYVRADAGGNQILLSFRSGRQPFRIVSLQDVKAGNFSPDWIRDRIVLIGVTASSSGDSVNTAAIDSANRSVVSGVEIQAHAVSQIVSAVLDGRPLLKVWTDGWEYVWIFAWGLLGISLGRIFLSPLKIILGLGVTSATLVSTCYVLLIMGWWIPVVPSLLVLIMNGGGLTSSLFYRYQQDVKTRLQERQFVLEKVFNEIHNSPLQSIASTLRGIEKQQLSSEQVYSNLKRLNSELREIYKFLRRETLTQDNNLYLSNGLKLDLEEPIHEVLHEVYSNTLEREFPCFKTLKIKIIKFEPIDSRFLSIEHKRGLCLFLEEALANVGKYAVGVTRLEVICIQEQGLNLIRVVDNGSGIKSLYKGIGTQLSQNLARQLGGAFQRGVNSPKGTICELTWSVKRPWYEIFNLMFPLNK